MKSLCYKIKKLLSIIRIILPIRDIEVSLSFLFRDDSEIENINNIYKRERESEQKRERTAKMSLRCIELIF